MIFVHSYEIELCGNKDVIQFYEYQKAHMRVCESDDIPNLVIISRFRNPLNHAMIAAIKQDIYEKCKIYPSVRHFSTLSFDELDIAL